MTPKEIVKKFEEENINDLLSILEELGDRKIRKKIKKMNRKILSSIDKIVFEQFDYQIHFNIINRFSETYLIISSSNDNHKDFYNIIDKDFKIYWSKLKNLD